MRVDLKKPYAPWNHDVDVDGLIVPLLSPTEMRIMQGDEQTHDGLVTMACGIVPESARPVIASLSNTALARLLHLYRALYDEWARFEMRVVQGLAARDRAAKLGSVASKAEQTVAGIAEQVQAAKAKVGSVGSAPRTAVQEAEYLSGKSRRQCIEECAKKAGMTPEQYGETLVNGLGGYGLMIGEPAGSPQAEPGDSKDVIGHIGSDSPTASDTTPQ